MRGADDIPIEKWYQESWMHYAFYALLLMAFMIMLVSCVRS